MVGWLGGATLAALDPLVWGWGWPEGPRRIFPGGPEGLEMPTPDSLSTSYARPHLLSEAGSPSLSLAGTPGSDFVWPAEPATNALVINCVCLFYCNSGLKRTKC